MTDTASRPAPSPRAQRVERFFSDLAADSIDLCDAFYTADVRFRDPVGEIDGLEALKRYYASMYAGVLEIGWTFERWIEQGDELVLGWVMHLRARKLRGGQPIDVRGYSVLTFDASDQVCAHEDCFDVGALAYEHVPFVGWLVRKIKRRLAAH